MTKFRRVIPWLAARSIFRSLLALALIASAALIPGALTPGYALAGGAPAGLSLAALIDSSAGRVLFTEFRAGRETAVRLLGQARPLSQESLVSALSDPRMSAAASAIHGRLSHVRIRFAERYPGTASALFSGSAPVSGLSAEQRSWLETICRDEFDRAFIDTLPAVPVSPLRASQEAAATLIADAELAIRTAPESAEARIRRWRRQYNESSDQLRELARITRGAALRASTAHQSLRKAQPAFDSLMRPEFVQEVLADSGAKRLATRAEKLFLTVRDDASAEPLSAKLARALEAQLAGEVPVDSIAARIDALRTSGSVKSIRRALGELTVEESRRLLVGSDPLRPSKQSLVGQYLAQTGAATMVRRFPVAPDSTVLGPERLVVAVDMKTITAFKRLIAQSENYFGQLHTPLQGTLRVAHGGSAGTYGALDGSLRMPSHGTMLPLVVLSTSEGGRMTRYFELGRAAQSGMLGVDSYDWSLSDSALKPWSLEGYCARGAYASCTHWIANIPIGDRLVTEYSFPGWVDHDPYTPEEWRGPQSPEPRVALLDPYGLSGAGSMGRELIMDVWSVPGHQQLADVLGVTEQALAAELTNPGWVAITMTARVPQERLPVVFLFVADAKAPIAPDFDTQVSAR
jgi:hypothetical protein